MTKEQSLFVQILSDYLNGRETEISGAVDWNIISQYAKAHQVSGIVFAQAKAFLPEMIREDLKYRMLATYDHSFKVREYLRAFQNALNEADIPFCVVKGLTIADLYPVPAFRSMSDIDLVVHPEDRGKVHEMILQKGFECISRQSDREWQYINNCSQEIELHDRLVYKEAVNDKGQERFFNDFWPYVKNNQIDWNFHLLFIIFHVRKHLMNAGAGFRQFMDLAVSAEHLNIDWIWVENKLKELSMLTFAKQCYGLINKWFGIATPLMWEIDEVFFESATSKTFEDGIFGFENAENKNSEVINQVRNRRFQRWHMIKVAVKELLPERKMLESLKTYEYLKKYPILLPAAWIHRVIRGKRKKKGKKVFLKLRQSFVSENDIRQRDEVLKKWGL